MDFEIVSQKTCSSCKIEFPLSMFGPSKQNKDGLIGRCRPCVNAARRKNYWDDVEASRIKGNLKAKSLYEKNPEKFRQRTRNATLKKKSQKPLPSPEELASKEADRLQRKRESRKRTYEKNKAKVLAQAAIYRSNHKEEERINRKAHYERNKEHCARVSDKYRRENREKCNAWAAKRRAAMLRAIPSWVDFEKIDAIYAEASRLSQETGIPHEVDHGVPLQGKTVCGLHVHDNLEIITATANRSKSRYRWPDMPE